MKHWITINEPEHYAKFGYDIGMAPQVRCSDRKICEAGNSATEPYIVTHNLLLAHATAFRLYREKFEVKILISIPITGLYFHWLRVGFLQIYE